MVSVDSDSEPPANVQKESGAEELADEREGEDSSAEEQADETEREDSVSQEHADEGEGEDSGAEEHADETEREDSDAQEHADEGEGEDSGAQEQADEIKAIGFALVLSAAVLPEFALPKGTVNCINCARIDTTRKVCTKEEIKALEDCMQRFFTRRPVLQSTPPRADNKAARVLKTNTEIADAWRLILERRRLVEVDDACPIRDPDILADMYTSWMHEWFAENLSEKQREFKSSQQSSIFAAYLHNNFGAKHFVMGLWQTGVQWAPPPKMLDNDPNGALEHVAKNFAKWTQRVARAVTRHKNDADTQEARRRSGSSYGKHGLSAEEEHSRWERQRARRNYYWTMELNRQLEASRPISLEPSRKRRKTDESVTPKSWSELTRDEQRWLHELWSGSLLAQMRRAESKCYKVQAKEFVVDEED